jgi:hypothetical protein
MLDFLKKDANRVGVLLSILSPLVILIVVLLVMSGSARLVAYVQTLLIFGTLSKVMSLCVYPNLAIFYLYLHYKRDKSAKGVVWGTLAMAAVVLLVYLIQKIY